MKKQTQSIKTQSIKQVRVRDRVFFWELARRGFTYYLRSNILFAAGCAVAAVILCGALLTGTSLRQSVRDLHTLRLGEVEWALVSSSGYFQSSIADSISAYLPVRTAPVMMVTGSVGRAGGSASVHRVNIIGVDKRFGTLGPAGTRSEVLDGVPSGGGDDVFAIVNTALAKKLNVDAGGEIVLRFQNTGGLAPDAPFGAQDDAAALRLQVASIVNPKQFGDFSLKAEHYTVYNVFVPLELLQSISGAQGLASAILVGKPFGKLLGDESKALGFSFDSFGKEDGGLIPVVPEHIMYVAHNSLSIADAGLNIRAVNPGGNGRDTGNEEIAAGRGADFEIYSNRVFISEPLRNAIAGVIPAAIPVSSWFVNSISTADSTTPYSFVSTPPVGRPLDDSRIELTAWTARDLNASVGDTVTLTYFVPRLTSGLRTDTSKFVVSAIHHDTVSWINRSLAPPYPGLDGAESCSNWDPSVPVDLKKIRPEDEAYWAMYEGTPKAIISYERAAQIWDNRFGVSTAIRIPRDASVFGSVNVIHSINDFERAVVSSLTPALCGIRLADVRADVDSAVNGGTDFAPLFLGLSIFTFAAALLLVWLLSALQVKSRADEHRALRAVGYSRKHILSVYLTEGMITFSIGTAAGIILSPLYTLIIIWGLKTAWQAAAQMPALSLYVDSRSIFIGGAAAFMCAMLAMLAPVWSAVRKMDVTRTPRWRARRPWVTHCLKIVKAAAEHQWIEPWLTKLQLTDFSMRRLAMLSALRGKKKFLGEAAILACALFILGITQMFHQRALTDPRIASSGTGGFVYYGEFNSGVPRDQTDAKFLRELGVGVNERGIDYIPFTMRMREGGDASCFNINKAAAPTLLGVDQKQLDETGAFTFASVIRNADPKHPWQILGASTGDENVVYGIADANTLEWGVGKSVGDTLSYINDTGGTLKVVIAASLKKSVLQGKVMIAEEDFVRRYPSASGYRALLIAASPEHEQAVVNALLSYHDKNGLNLESTTERLAAFNAVENTYLSIFAILGMMGLMLGCAGMGIIVMRNIEERRGELALMRVQGFSAGQLKRLLFTEHAMIALAGTAAGLLPAFVLSTTAFSVSSLLRIVCLLVIVLSCGTVSILLGLRGLGRTDALTILKKEAC